MAIPEVEFPKNTDPAHFVLGRLSATTEPSGATAYRYDRRGLLTSEAKTIGGQTFTSAFQYDANGNRSAIHYPSGRNVTGTFDYADRPFSASAGTTTLVSSATYLPFGPATDIVFGNGTARHMTFDNRYRLSTNQLNGSGDPIVSNQYHYDAAGNITGIDDQIEPAFNRSFGYDDLNRLTAANSGEALWGQGSYNYDAMGNVRTLSLGARNANFTYDGTTPKLVSVDENNQSREVIYDGAGNERRVGIDTGMTYTPSNHLERWKDTTYMYDARGVRTTTVRPVRIVNFSVAPSTRSTTVTLQPPPVTLASLTLASQSIIGTNDVVATITLTGPAPAGGVEVEMMSSNPAVAAVPPVLTVPAGTTSGTLFVTTSLVTADTQVTINAMHATTAKTATLSVLHPSGNYVASVTITPAFIAGGTSASGTVTLAMPSSDHGGSDVALSSSNAALSGPGSVKVNPNSSTSTFTIATSAVTAPVPTVVTASYGGVTQRMNVIVAPENAVTLASVTIVPNRVTGGAPAIATVALNRAAPLGGARVTVEAKRRNIVTGPDSVMVPEGASYASFSIATDPLHAAREKSVEIVATYNNVSASATLTVLPTAQATSSHKPSALCASLVLVPCVTQSVVRVIKPLGGGDDGPPPSTTPTLFEQQYTFYTPELNLMSETNSTSTVATPVIAYDYVWFGGQPLAQIENATGSIAWYFNDHLGTPIRQTDDTGHVLWQAEYEPYGTIYAIRRGEARHQPLRLLGQTEEDGSDLYQNVFRFYRAGWGRYTQVDAKTQYDWPYQYGDGNPVTKMDPLGESTVSFGPVREHLVPIDEVYRNCASSSGGLKGCARLTGLKWHCDCQCGNEGFHRSISIIGSGIDVFIATNAPSDDFINRTVVPEDFIRTEEMKHVRDFQDFARSIKDSLDLLEQAAYSSKGSCEKGCAAAFDWVAGLLRDRIRRVDASHPPYYGH